VLTDKEVIDFFTNEMILAKVNGKEDTLLADQYHISAYPTLVMLDKNGNEIDRVVGYMPADAFLKTLKDYRQGIGTLTDLLAKAKTNPDRSLAFKIAEKYKYRGGSEDATSWFQKVIDAGDPLDSLSGESRFALAGMHYRAKNYNQALEAYSQIIKDFNGSFLAEPAEIWRAIVFRKMGDTTRAITAFEKFIEHYPESEDISYAEKQIAKLKGETEEEK